MPQIYTVSQVNSYIKNMFDTDTIMKRISITGEISECKYHSSGHIYLTLKDQQCSIKAVMFHRNAMSLRFRLDNGMKIVATGYISIYETNGSCQLYITSVERAGAGELHARFLALKKELEEMGMFDASFKKPIPQYARRIGVVTSKTGAVIQDILNVSSRRNPYVQIILYPALVQGEGAAKTIVSGIQYFDQVEPVDTIIIGRGGGSLEDLWCFNEEIVARAIFDCQTPIISAVGHETDFSIADLVADHRAPTPSAAAEVAVFDWMLLMERYQQVNKRLNLLMSHRIEQCRSKLNQYQSITLQMRNRLISYRSQLERYRSRLNNLSPEHQLNVKRQNLCEKEDRIRMLMKMRLQQAQNDLRIRCTRLEAASPLRKIESGFAYVSLEEHAESATKKTAIHSIQDVKSRDLIRIQVMDGVIKAQVEETISDPLMADYRKE